MPSSSATTSTSPLANWSSQPCSRLSPPTAVIRGVENWDEAEEKSNREFDFSLPTVEKSNCETKIRQVSQTLQGSAVLAFHHSIVPSLQHSNFQHSSIPTSNIPPRQHSNFQHFSTSPFQHFRPSPLQRSSIPTFQYSNISTFRHSSVPAPAFQRSTIPAFQHIVHSVPASRSVLSPLSGGRGRHLRQ